MSQKGAPPMQSQYSTGQASGYAPSVVSSSMAGRRSHNPPPRIRPVMIIVMVLAVGLLFIGLIMTIIAVWPGYTPTGGNPLKIAGPVLLGIGLLVLIIGIINICYRDQNQKKKQQRQQLLYAQSLSRTTLNSYQHPQTPTPSMDAKPGRSILKKAGSTSTYNGTANRESDGSGVLGTNNSFSTNRSYESGDSMSGSGSADMGHMGVNMNPDPTAPRQKGRSQQPPRKPAYANPGYHGDGGDHDGRRQPQPQNPEPRRQMQSYPNQGYDMYDKKVPSSPAVNTGQGLITGHGLLSYSSPQPRSQQPQQLQQQSRGGGGGSGGGSGGWGASRQGAANTAYMPDQSVSTVTHQYQAATTPSHQYQEQYQYQQRTPKQTPNTSSSTEV